METEAMAVRHSRFSFSGMRLKNVTSLDCYDYVELIGKVQDFVKQVSRNIVTCGQDQRSVY